MIEQQLKGNSLTNLPKNRPLSKYFLKSLAKKSLNVDVVGIFKLNFSHCLKVQHCVEHY
jgi:hypothetical protein